MLVVTLIWIWAAIGLATTVTAAGFGVHRLIERRKIAAAPALPEADQRACAELNDRLSGDPYRTIAALPAPPVEPSIIDELRAAYKQAQADLHERSRKLFDDYLKGELNKNMREAAQTGLDKLEYRRVIAEEIKAATAASIDADYVLQLVDRHYSALGLNVKTKTYESTKKNFCWEIVLSGWRRARATVKSKKEYVNNSCF